MADNTVKRKMHEIKVKDNPTSLERLKLVRFFVNSEKYTEEKIYSELAHWPRQDVENSIHEVIKENSRPRPKRYYVSLKEPLEDSSFR
ncbi:MAG: hypothetical protein KKF44_09560 [Nanoarchaeota archaeon]|nr:hypothetical protein [Nanoarchaeota archaeon]